MKLILQSRFFIGVIICSIVFSCNNWSKQETFSDRALVILSGDQIGMFYQDQRAIIAYTDKVDSTHILRIKLPGYSRPALPGDSVEIIVSSSGVKFGKLYPQGYSIKDRFEYQIRKNDLKHIALFDNGVLTIGTINKDGSVVALDFYVYQERNTKNELQLYSVGKNGKLAFSFLGKLSDDSLLVSGSNDVFYRR